MSTQTRTWGARLTYNGAHLRFNDKKTRPSALGMSDPIMDFVIHDIKRRTEKKNWRKMKPRIPGITQDKRGK